MGKSIPTKEKRNKKIVELKKEMSFRKLAKLFDISGARVKEIYDREVKRRKDT